MKSVNDICYKLVVVASYDDIIDIHDLSLTKKKKREKSPFLNDENPTCTMWFRAGHTMLEVLVEDQPIYAYCKLSQAYVCHQSLQVALQTLLPTMFH